MKKRMFLFYSFLIFSAILAYFSFIKCFGNVPEASINRFFKELKNMNIDTAVTYLNHGNEYKKRLDFKGDYEKEIMNLVYPKLKYRIISKVINGDTARVEIQYQAVSVYDMASWAISNILPGLYISPYSNKLKPGADKEMYEIILYYINNGYPPMNKGIMDIKLVKDHDTNKWLIIPDDNLIGMINGDAYEVFGYYDYIFSQNTTVFSVGKEVISGTGGITVEKVDRIAEPAFDKDLVLIHVKIRNTSDRVIAYDSFDFKIQTSSNNIVEQLYNQTTLTSGELEPGQYVTGIITYEIKRNDKDLNLLLINEPVVLARFIL